MSKLIAFAAIQGGYKVVSTAEGELRNALETFDADSKIEFPNTGYYLPVIYSITGMKVKTLEDLKKPLEFSRGLLPPQSSFILRGSCHQRSNRGFSGQLPAQGRPRGGLTSIYPPAPELTNFLNITNIINDLIGK